MILHFPWHVTMPISPWMSRWTLQPVSINHFTLTDTYLFLSSWISRWTIINYNTFPMACNHACLFMDVSMNNADCKYQPFHHNQYLLIPLFMDDSMNNSACKYQWCCHCFNMSNYPSLSWIHVIIIQLASMVMLHFPFHHNLQMCTYSWYY